MTVVHAGDAPDPFVLRVGGTFWCWATQHGAVNVQLLSSPDLRTWTAQGDALPSLPAWAASGRTWSPAVLPRGKAFVLYVAVRQKGPRHQAIAVLTADHPAGPYVDALGTPLIYQSPRGGSIDPEPFVDVDGQAWLSWKSDDNAIGRRSCLWVRRLRADGLGFRGRAHKILRHEQLWERPLVEAPSLTWVRGRYHLLYSGGAWESPGYGVGHAVADRITGPYAVSTLDAPWLSGPDGPGGQSVVTGLDGRLYLARHAWLGPVGYAHGGIRALHVDPLDLSGPSPRLLAW